MPKVRACILTNVATGEEKRFDTTCDAEIFLGCKLGYIRRRQSIDMPIIGVDGITYTARQEKSVYISHQNTEAFKRKMNEPQQICWDCAKACGKCSWSRCLKPVEGWTAEIVYVKQALTRIQTYHITDCPQFVEG